MDNLHREFDSVCSFKSCSFFNPDCNAQNADCALSKKRIVSDLKDAVNRLASSRHSLDHAKSAFSVAQGDVSDAIKGLKMAEKALNDAMATYSAGVKASSALIEFGLSKIIKITKMYFHVELSVANSGVFQCQVEVELMGAQFNLNLKFDTGDIVGIAKSLGEVAIPGVSRFFG